MAATAAVLHVLLMCNCCCCCWLHEVLPVHGIATLAGTGGVTCLCNEVALHIVEEAIVVVLHPSSSQQQQVQQSKW